MAECCESAKHVCDCLASFCKDYDCKVEETKTGIQVSISPKDSTKVDSFKETVKTRRQTCCCS